MLPDIEGIEVGRRLRARGFKTAVLFLTAKDATENKVEALRAGGDDYVTKPFSLAEIVARIQAILRRTAGALPGDVLRFADLVLDEGRHEVHRGDTPIPLTATEFSLLRYFMLNPRRVLSKAQILQNVWRYDFGGNANVVETYVSYLRRKLDAAGPAADPDGAAGRLHARSRRPDSAAPALAARAARARRDRARAAGLAVANVATYASLRSFLLDRTDQSLRRLRARARALGARARTRCGGPGDRAPRGAEPGDYVQVRDVRRRGRLQPPGAARSARPRPSPPGLPARSRRRRTTGRRRRGRSTSRSLEGRRGAATASRAVARSSRRTARSSSRRPLGDVDATLGRLLADRAARHRRRSCSRSRSVGLWVVRLGLRPLDAIGATAEAIAGGDLSRRVERAERDTEVGRLGLALNAMLGQIETAFNAQEASERKLRRFVADASHELRTPLAAVRAYAELFSRGADRRPDDLARSMTGISRESERMSLLVDDLLLLARLDEGRPLEREPVAARRGRLARPSRRRGRSSRSGRSSSSRSPSVVLGDRDRLRQIVDNLLANVRAHTPAGTPVDVRLATGERPRRDRRSRTAAPG